MFTWERECLSSDRFHALATFYQHARFGSAVQSLFLSSRVPHGLQSGMFQHNFQEACSTSGSHIALLSHSTLEVLGIQRCVYMTQFSCVACTFIRVGSRLSTRISARQHSMHGNKALAQYSAKGTLGKEIICFHEFENDM